ncbi:MAG: RlmE family RNA methyltransferase [Deltaproteobacteria bacterium]|nr:RlmE family RNA methyltransferase [Deltaproteobacteria bacterium]
MAYDRKDSWYRRAKQSGFRSRAAYKLIELDRRFGLLRPGARVVDLGCAPGGWLQVAARRVGRRGRAVGIDKLAIEPLDAAQVEILQADIAAADSLERLRRALGGPADTVLSDMAPETSGVGFADHARSVELARLALDAACALLREGGSFAAKVFDGPDLDALAQEIAQRFGKLRRVRPEATRKGSRELYLVALSFRSRAEP